MTSHPVIAAVRAMADATSGTSCGNPRANYARQLERDYAAGDTTTREAWLIDAKEALRQWTRQDARDAGMTAKQAKVYAVLRDQRGSGRPLTAREISDQLGISRAAALSRLKALERSHVVRSWYSEPGVKVWVRP